MTKAFREHKQAKPKPNKKQPITNLALKGKPTKPSQAKPNQITNHRAKHSTTTWPWHRALF
jgi:hypothetical protein